MPRAISSEPQPLEEVEGARHRASEGRRQAPAEAPGTSLLKIEDRAWLVTTNYEALLAYNCAHTYALSVATLARTIAKWPRTRRYS